MKKRILTDLTIECEPPRTYLRKTMEQRAEFYENWIREFDEFIRDHRSQDPVNLTVNRTYTDVCSFCNNEWELDDDFCPVCCKEAQEEHEALKIKEVI
jgi:hypothetical protein